MRNVFISYSRNDKEYVYKIVDIINEINGIECWVDKNDIESGAESFPTEISNGVNKCFIFLYMLSKSSMDSSCWAIKELLEAEELQTKDKTRKIVLVNIDDNKPELTGEFTKYNERDIISWKFTEQNRKLLKDINRWNCEKAESLFSEGEKLENASNMDDKRKAFDLFLESAKMGCSEAQSKIAYYYRHGKGVVDIDLPEALIWGGKAYEQHYPGAASLMAQISQQLGDNANFIRYHKEAAESGWAFSQYQLGKAYKNKVIEGNIIDAIYWLKKAACQNQPDAQKLLGDILKDDFNRQKELSKEYYNKAKENYEKVIKTSHDEQKKKHAQQALDTIFELEKQNYPPKKRK